MSWSWYGVKTIFRTEARGKPQAVDSAYEPDATLIEERIVLFRARSYDEAIRKAEKEAREYASLDRINPYGQKVVTRYLKACDAFIIYDSLGAGAEVYSATEVIGKQVSDKEILDCKLGKEGRVKRKKFLNREFAGVVKSAI